MATIKQKTDQTIGGNNYYIQPSNQQGQQNALVGSGAVAGIKEQPTVGKKLSSTRPVTPIREAGAPKTDQTIGGNNYYYKDPVQQGLTNPLVGSGAVAGIPEQPKVGQKFTGNFTPFQIPERQVTTPQPTPTPTKKTTPQQPQPQPQEEINHDDEFAQNPQEEINHDDEFAKAPEQPTEQPQEEAPTELATIEGENKEGTIYGRASGESQQTINTNADQYSADQSIQAERQKSLNNLQVMDSYNVAVSIANGYTPYGDQAMRDLQQYDPQKYQEIQDHIKTIQKGETVNQIAKDGKIDITGQIKNTTDTINNDIDDWVKRNSTTETYQGTLNNLTDKLASSQTAQTATQEMLNINKDIAEIQEKMNNLPNEAKKVFKGDVPDYLVQAYVSNRTQEYQSQLNKLQSRYQSASDLYKTELSQKQWEAEMELKQQQLAMDKSQMQWNMYLQNAKFQADQEQQMWERGYNMEKLNYANIQNIGGEAYIKNSSGQWTKLSEDIAYQSYQSDFQSKLKNYLNSFKTGKENIQCEKFSNDITEAVTGLRMKTKTNFGGTTAQEKASYVNDREPRIGNVAVFDYGIVQDNGVNYGHTAMVTGYDPSTGIVELTEANYNGDGKITTRQVKLGDIMNSNSFQGYWNPFMDQQAQSVKNNNNAVYDYVNTPMTDIYEQAYADAKDTKEREGIHNSFEGYKKLNDLVKKGAIDLICNSSDFDTLIQRINENKFLDSSGNIDFSAVGEYARNSLKNEDLSLGIDALRRLIEIKLRRESGAAISMTEWDDQFTRYLPQLGQSPEEKRRRIIDMERDCVLGSLGDPKYQKLYIPLISEVSTYPNEIRDD